VVLAAVAVSLFVRWRGCLPPVDADQRAHRLARDLDRYRRLRDDIEAIDLEVVALLAETNGQILTTLPGVASTRAAASPRTAFRSRDLPTPNIFTRQRVWPKRSISRPRCTDAAESRARDWPSTAMH
jgi:hypothetical protein